MHRARPCGINVSTSGRSERTQEEARPVKIVLKTVTYKIGEELVTDVAMHLLELFQVLVSLLHAHVPHAHSSHHFHTGRFLGQVRNKHR